MSTFDQNDSGYNELQACVQLPAIEIEMSWRLTAIIRPIVERHTQPDDSHDTTSHWFSAHHLHAVTGLLKVGGSEEHRSEPSRSAARRL